MGFIMVLFGLEFWCQLDVNVCRATAGMFPALGDCFYWYRRSLGFLGTVRIVQRFSSLLFFSVLFPEILATLRVAYPRINIFEICAILDRSCNYGDILREIHEYSHSSAISDPSIQTG